MNGFRRILIYISYKILIYAFCDERYHRSRNLTDSNKSRIKGHVCVDLILWHTFYPVSLTTAANIPVTHIIHKLGKNCGSLRNLVITEVLVKGLNSCIKL